MQQTNYVLGVWIFPLVAVLLEKPGPLVTDNQSAEKEDINSNIYYWFRVYKLNYLFIIDFYYLRAHHYYWIILILFWVVTQQSVQIEEK